MSVPASVLFLSVPRRSSAGSAYLRAHQMCEIASRTPRLAGTACLRTHDIRAATGSVVVFDKYATLAASDRQLASARRRNNLLIADPVDGTIPPARLERFDGVIAAAETQAEDYRALLRKPVAYVRHHVDMRLESFIPRRDRFVISYFGEIANARFSRELKGLVDFVPIDTRHAEDTRWMRRMCEANAHYAVRPPLPRFRYKPFMKGFVAAMCNAPVLVDAADREAARFLPPEYPYVVDATSAAEVRAMIIRMRCDFGGPQWVRALAAMESVRAACHPDLCAGDFADALRLFCR